MAPVRDEDLDSESTLLDDLPLIQLQACHEYREDESIIESVREA